MEHGKIWKSYIVYLISNMNWFFFFFFLLKFNLICIRPMNFNPATLLKCLWQACKMNGHVYVLRVSI